LVPQEADHVLSKRKEILMFDLFNGRYLSARARALLSRRREEARVSGTSRIG
jgi:hypothetical protein